MLAHQPPSRYESGPPLPGLRRDGVAAELARLLGGTVDYDLLRAASEGNLAAVRRELRRLRRAIDRAETLLSGTDPAC